MTEWRFHSGAGFSISLGGVAQHGCILGSYRDNSSPVEATHTFKAQLAYTFENMKARSNTLTVNAILEFRDDGVSSSNIIITFTTANTWVEDLTGSETPAANSELNWQFNNVSGMHDDIVQCSKQQLGYFHASTDEPLMGGSDNNLTTSSFHQMSGGGDGETTEANAELLIQRAHVMSDLRLHATELGTLIGTWVIHLNQTNSTNLTISVSGSAYYEDLTGSETLAADDEINHHWDRTSGTLDGHIYQVVLDTVESWFITNAAQDVTTREYAPFLTDLAATIQAMSTTIEDEWDGRIGSVLAGNFEVIIVTAGTGTREYALRTGAGTSTNVIVTVTGTGRFTDLTGTEAIADDEHIGLTAVSSGDAVRSSLVAVEFPFTALTTPDDQPRPAPLEYEPARALELLAY